MEERPIRMGKKGYAMFVEMRLCRFQPSHTTRKVNLCPGTIFTLLPAPVSLVALYSIFPPTLYRQFSTVL